MPSDHDLTGTTLDGRYRLTRLLGEGGMGQVYEGVHQSLDRKVAVKVLLPQLALEPKFRERFLREAKAASTVRHPNVVHILDFGDTPEGLAYFVMEYLEGRDLQAVLREDGRLPWPRARALLLQITSALAAAHDHRIVHRDIKPANCFIMGGGDQRELVKLLDFGIAKITADPGDGSTSRSLTGTGEVLGTAKYMAPEQAVGSTKDPRVDVYSVGIVAYEMLTGQVPFTGQHPFHILTKHVYERPRPPRELATEIPSAVEAIILRALAKRPEDRFGSMHEMKRALAEVTAESRGPSEATSSSNRSSGARASSPSGPSPAPIGDVAVTVPMPQPGSGDPASGSHEDGTEPQDAAHHGQPPWERQPDALVDSRARWRATSIVVGIIGVLAAVAALLWLRDRAEPRSPSAADMTAPRTKEEQSPSTLSPVSGRNGVHDGAAPPNVGSHPAATTNSSALEAESTSEAGGADPSTSTSEPAILSSSEPQPSSDPKLPKEPKLKKPPTDETVRARLSRSIEKRCRSLGEGVEVTVDILVGSDGRISNKLVRGAVGELERCVLDEVAKARFSPGIMRKIAIKASL